MTEARYISCADTAKLVRAALKTAFPSQKFSVRSSTYSMGASIDVSWEEGPTVADVNSVVKPFAGATFDGMNDSTEYHVSMLNGEAVSFGADYVITNRWVSDARRLATDAALREVSPADRRAVAQRIGYHDDGDLIPNGWGWDAFVVATAFGTLAPAVPA